MEKHILELFSDFFLGRITKEGFVARYFKDGIPDRGYCLGTIERGMQLRDSDLIEVGLKSIFIAELQGKFFSKILCELLPEKWHTSHEDIVLLLSEIKDETTIGCLYKVIETKFDYLDYDESDQFARKCIKALSAIGGIEAKRAILELTHSTNPNIVHFAKKELNKVN